MIIANVTGQRLKLRGDNAVSDSVEYLKIRFETDSEWSDYDKTAVFRDFLGNAYSIPLIDDNPFYLGDGTCYIPYEVIKEPHFTVSIFGSKNSSVITTPEITVYVEKSGYGDGAKPQEPTPGEYEQILSVVSDVRLIAESVREDADNGEFKGDKGDRGEQGVSGVYVGSGEMPEGYNVQIDPNGQTVDMNTFATKEYVDAAVNSIDPEVDLSNYATKAELNDELDIIEQTVSDISVDYITEKGETTVDGVTWSWEKWNSGKAVCWGTKLWELSRTGNYWWGDISLPFTFYKAANTINDFCITLSGGTNHTGALYTDSTALYSTSTVTVINTASDYVEEAHDVGVHYHIIGKWK